MSQVQTSQRRRILNRGVSICAMCKKSCDGRLCGWANTLKTENLPEGAEFVLSRVERDKSNKEKSYYKITSCPVFECGHSRTTPEDAAALRLAERLLWELSEGFEQALINGDRAAEREYEYDIRSCWIWHIFAQSGLNDKTADSCIAAIRQRVEDARQYDFIADQMKQNSQQLAVIAAIIIIALGMTAIGMISNQLLGFEGRKKECAVMLSTAMGKGKLSGILFKEVLITSVTASGIGTIVGLLMINVIEKAMASTQSISMSFDVNPLTVFLFFIAMTVVFTGTVLFPIRNLRKMKISEQIKYE